MENEMRDVDLDGDNLCPHDKYFEDCDDCIDDKKWCHYECDDVSGCGVLIHSALSASSKKSSLFFILLSPFFLFLFIDSS
jgi:hypothetical protein